MRILRLTLPITHNPTPPTLPPSSTPPAPPASSPSSPATRPATCATYRTTRPASRSPDRTALRSSRPATPASRNCPSARSGTIRRDREGTEGLFFFHVLLNQDASTSPPTFGPYYKFSKYKQYIYTNTSTPIGLHRRLARLSQSPRPVRHLPRMCEGSALGGEGDGARRPPGRPLAPLPAAPLRGSAEGCGGRKRSVRIVDSRRCLIGSE